MTLAVYAISKNVQTSVDRFMDGVDAISAKAYVLDHSSDGTALALLARGATVHTTPIVPWRFDAGKNYALDMVGPEFDFVINIDLDESICVEPMKRLLEQLDEHSTDRVLHLYQPDSSIDRVREETRIHRRDAYRWLYPIHECLMPNLSGEKVQKIDECVLVQHPDRNRKHTWSRMLEDAVREYPDSARMRMFAGRDFYFDGRYEQSLKQFGAFLGLNPHPFEASYALTMMARCHKKLGDKNDLELAMLRSAAKVCTRRESWVELAHAYLMRGQDSLVLPIIRTALKCTDGEYAAHSDPKAWSFAPHEIAMTAAYNVDDLKTAIHHGEIAERLSTGEDRERISTLLLTFKAKSAEMEG